MVFVSFAIGSNYVKIPFNILETSLYGCLILDIAPTVYPTLQCMI